MIQYVHQTVIMHPTRTVVVLALDVHVGHLGYTHGSASHELTLFLFLGPRLMAMLAPIKVLLCEYWGASDP
jgi:hypothetical protein